MSIDTANDIRRLENGSIDYGYYATIGKRARYGEIKAIPGAISKLSSRSVKALPVVTVLIVLNLVLW